jgi:hypothetical protein
MVSIRSMGRRRMTQVARFAVGAAATAAVATWSGCQTSDSYKRSNTPSTDRARATPLPPPRSMRHPEPTLDELVAEMNATKAGSSSSQQCHDDADRFKRLGSTFVERRASSHAVKMLSRLSYHAHECREHPQDNIIKNMADVLLAEIEAAWNTQLKSTNTNIGENHGPQTYSFPPETFIKKFD